MSEDKETNISTPEEVTLSFMSKSKIMAQTIVGANVGIAIAYGICNAIGVEWPSPIIMIPALEVGGVAGGLSVIKNKMQDGDK